MIKTLQTSQRGPKGRAALPVVKGKFTESVAWMPQARTLRFRAVHGMLDVLVRGPSSFLPRKPMSII